MALLDIFSSSSGESAAAKARRASTQAAKRGADKQVNVTTKGYNAGREALAPALTNIGDIYAQEQQGRQAYMGALGLGTPEEQAAARARFQASPGYQYQLDQGNQSILRNSAAGGYLRGGQTATDLADYSQNLANQDWGNWLNRLGGFNPLAANQQQGGLATTLSNLNVGQGNALSNIYGNKFNTIGQANAAYPQNVYGAQQGALQNQWGAINAGVNLGAKLAGSFA